MAIETMNGVGQADLAGTLQQYKQKAERMQTEHARAEAQLEQIARQREEALLELSQLSVSEDSLQAEIDQIDAEMAQLIEEIRRLLEDEADGNVDAE